ncbi:MAG TPA: FGGY family carbohydrate kinase, partial [Kofleriaceae bacterium]|nr:FGGY family carbohydrate kinase [Kofleriaceae bacterium]
MAQLLGIDLGTSGARAVLVEAASGRVVAGASAEYPLHTPRPLWAEQDPHDWWQGAVAAVRAALAAGGRVDVRGVGLSGQMHGVVLLDDRGEPIGRSLLWCDGRTGEECAEITRRAGGEERLLDLSG